MKMNMQRPMKSEPGTNKAFRSRMPKRSLSRRALVPIAVALGLFAGAGCDSEEERGQDDPDRGTSDVQEVEDFLDFHICGEGTPDWTESNTTFVTSHLGYRMKDIKVTYHRTGNGPTQVNTQVTVGKEGSWRWVQGWNIVQLNDGDSRVWTPQLAQARDFHTDFTVRTQQGYYPPGGGSFVDDPIHYERITQSSGNVEVRDHIYTKTFETQVPGGTLEWKVRFLPMNRVVPSDEEGNQDEWCATPFSPDDGYIFDEQVTCAEWAVNCPEEYECIAEGLCNDCNPGPTGLCAEHIANTIQEHGGPDMQEHADDIVAHIHHGKEPAEEWEGRDSNFHEIQGTPPQDGGGDDCYVAKVELGAELTLDTAAFLSDIFFINTSGYFTNDMRVAARPIARGMIAENGAPVVDYVNTMTHEAHEATRLEKTGKAVFGLLGANGFTHVIFEAIKTKYNHGLTWRDKWHIASDVLVGATTAASMLDPAFVGLWTVRIATLVRTFADVTNLGIDLERNIKDYREKCHVGS